MGFRFDLESANIVANLACGKVLSCYEEIFSSEKNYYTFIDFLNSFSENIYSIERDRILNEVEMFSRLFEEKRYYTNGHYDNHNKYRRINSFSGMDEYILDELKMLSNIFKRCKIKALILPSLDNKKNDDLLMSDDFVKYLYSIHPGDSCLILQPKERLYENTITIFNAFPYFENALKNADLWPAILFWNDDDYAFIPIDSGQEVISLFKMIYYEESINVLKKYTFEKKEKEHYYIQISDLHFGTKNASFSKKRLKSLIESQVNNLELNDNIDFIVTGDSVDSPTKVNYNDYLEFDEFLQSQSGKKPLFVLGNHDVNIKGLSFTSRNRVLANYIGEYPKIVINKEINVIFLLFNSNTDGYFAEGMIGNEQMLKMGNLLDNVQNLENYKLVAVLHHHVVNIPKPKNYDKRWYKKIVPSSSIDNTLRLIDAELFLEWLIKRNVNVVLHGHKHIPFLTQYQGITIISCGSSTGNVNLKDKSKTYINFNVLKITNNKLTCSQIIEELYGAGPTIKTTVIDL